MKLIEPGNDQAGTIFLTWRTTKLTSVPLTMPSMSPIGVTMTCLTAVLADHLLQRVGEILDDDDRLGAGILQLMLEFARRVERVDIDDDAAGAQRAEQRHRVLQQVGHHQRDAIALLEADRLQPAGEIARQAIQLAVGHLAIHADVGNLIGILRCRRPRTPSPARRLVDADFGGNARRVGLDPDLFHFCLLLQLISRPAAPS